MQDLDKDKEIAELQKKATRAEEAKQFLDSDMGKTVMGWVDEDEADLKNVFNVDITSEKKCLGDVMGRKYAIFKLEDFKQRFQAIIDEGDYALSQIEFLKQDNDILVIERSKSS